MVRSPVTVGDQSVIQNELSEAENLRARCRTIAEFFRYTSVLAFLAFLIYLTLAVIDPPAGWRIIVIAGLVSSSNWFGSRRLFARASELDEVVAERRAALSEAEQAGDGLQIVLG